MRWLFGVFLFTSAFCSANSEIAFQKVYEIDGMSASEIREAFGDPTIDVGMDTISKTQDIINTSVGKGWQTGLNEAKTGRLRCNIAAVSWLPDVNEWVDADVVVQVKDGKARITIASLDVNGPGKSNCLESVEAHLDSRFELIKELGGDW